MRKKLVLMWIAIIGGIILLSTIGVTMLLSNRTPNSPPTIVQADYYPANFKQRSSIVQMGVYQDNLYVYTYPTLYVLHDEGLFPVEHMEDYAFFICDNGIYHESGTDTYDVEIWHMDPDSKENTFLVTIDSVHYRNFYISQEGTLFLPVNAKFFSSKMSICRKKVYGNKTRIY